VSDLSVAGPMGRSADDLALGMEVLVKPEADQAKAWRIELPPPRHTALKDFRVAAWLDDPDCPVDAAVLNRLQGTVEALRKAGVKVNEKARPDIPRFAETDRIYRSLLVSATAARSVSDNSFPRLADEEDALAWETEESGPETPHNGALRHRTWQRLNEKRLQIREKWEAFFQDFDVVLMPVTQVTALPHDHSQPQRDRVMTVNGTQWPYTDQLAWVGLITMAYLPSTAAPVGLSSNGLPVGVQIVSGYAEDRTTIEFAQQLAGVIGGSTPPPNFAK
jgi:amidase